MCEDSAEVEQERLTLPSSMPDSTSLTTSDTGSDNRGSEKNILTFSPVSISNEDASSDGMPYSARNLLFDVMPFTTIRKRTCHCEAGSGGMVIS
uniref:Uncharacterized protein n=1 Tax=Amphimedon queenslandica TaxID=400682 RepID=A0A1X7U2P6_AMPQE